MKTRWLYVLVVLAAAGCKSRESADSSSAEALNSPSQFESRTIYDFKRENGGTVTFAFYNFSPVDPAAQRGLDNIYTGDGFSPLSPPLKIMEASRSSKGIVPDLYFNFGTLPSPPSRKSGTNTAHPEYDFGISASVLPVWDCTVRGVKTLATAKLTVRDSVACGTDAPTTNVVSENCFTCHAGLAKGTVVAGLGNAQDNEVLIAEELKKLVAAQQQYYPANGKPGIGSQVVKWASMPKLTDFEQHLLQDFSDYLQKVVINIFASAKSRGDNFAPYWVWKYIGKLKVPVDGSLEDDKADNPVDRQLFGADGKRALGTIDPMPWWLLRFKSTVYWVGEKHNAAKDFAYNFLRPAAGAFQTFSAHIGIVDDILAFAKNTTSPPYPNYNQIDRDKAKKGAELFHQKKIMFDSLSFTCSSCHGSYDISNAPSVTVTYPGPSTHAWDVGTDPLYSALNAEMSQALEAKAKKIVGYVPNPNEISEFTVRDDIGVLPPPLVGIWASAPYFHNGSAPTVYSVLKPKARPSRWTRSLDPEEYDLNDLGLQFSESGKPNQQSKLLSVPSRALELATYDTTLPGKTNTGHTFAADWQDDEVYAVIEFLKLISGPGVVPSAATPAPKPAAN